MAVADEEINFMKLYRDEFAQPNGKALFAQFMANGEAQFAHHLECWDPVFDDDDDDNDEQRSPAY